MKPGFLRSSTAMVLVASLATAPVAGFAQTDNGAVAENPSDPSEILRKQLEDAARAEAEAEAEAEAAPEAEAEAEAEPAPEAEAVPEAAQAEPAPEAEAVPEAAQAEPEPEAEAVPEAAQAEPEPEAEAEPEAVEAEPEAEAEAEPEAAEAEPEADAQPEAAEAEAETTPEADALPEAAQAGSEPEADAEPDAAEAAPEADAEPDAAEADSEADTASEADGATDPAAEQPQTEAATTADDDQPAAEQAAGAADGTDDGEATESAESENVTPMDSEAQAAIEAEADADVPAAMAGAEGEAEPEAVEETVTEETARSSDEEFNTDLQGEVRAEARKKDDDDDDDDGMSNFEKAALLGIGAVAIGSMLRSNETVAANTGDRVIAEQNGQYRVIKNDDALLRQPGSDIRTFNYSDGSTRTIVTREDGSEVETIRAADGRVLRRARTLPDGSTALLFDDTQQSTAVDVSTLPQISTRRTVDFDNIAADDLAATLAAAQAANVNRTFSLSQIRNINAVRQLVPEINVDSVTFETNSAVIRPEEAEELSTLGNAMKRMIDANPSEVFLIEGHTDAVGSGAANLALSDRRAESVALALTEYFDVPPENLVVQGYGESDLLVSTAEAERANRRAAVRRITPLLDGSNT